MSKPFARFGVRIAAAAALLLPLPLAAQVCGDCIFTQSFENQFSVPATDAEAARFLNQATFGATRSDISTVRSVGYEGYLDQQMAASATLARPALEVRAAQQRALNQTINQDDRIHLWFNTAVTAPDQVRQKVAHALAQIIVTSDQADALAGEPIQMAEWNDIHVRHAFGNYRDLLREVSFSPMMGKYLTHLRNRKFELTPRCRPNGNPSGLSVDCNSATTAPFFIAPSDGGGTSYSVGNNGNEPDENYAREIMQLFSIGLVTRNMDFSIVEESPGVPLATYDQQMIRTLARAFTGLAYDCTGTRVVQGVTIQQNCSGTRNSVPPVNPPCTGIDCRFSNLTSLFFNDPPRSRLPNDSGDSSLVHPDFYAPLVCYPRYNDNGRDRKRFQLPGQGPTNPVNTTIQSGVTIPAGAQDADKALVLSGTTLQTIEEFRPGASKETVPDCESTSLAATTPAQRLECVNYCEDSVRSVSDLLFNHPNTAPMVARQLILHLVTSNPSPQYIQRVATVFADNGGGVRGDMRAVVRAILIDPEARQPSAGQFGKVREPLLKLVSVWRHFGAVSADNRRWGPTNPQTAYLQRPHGAPSVFNFYEPDYQQPGAIAAANLYSPEFQIINENTTMLAANDLFARICSGWNGGNNNCGATGTAAAFTQPTDRAYLPPAQIDALPGMSCATQGLGCSGTDDVALVEELNIRMMGGAMSGAIANPSGCSGNTGMKSTLHCLLRSGLAGNLGQTNANAITAAVDARRRKALYLIHLISISPEYAHQR
jgi:uncharacterized protein (DUF1800 family)